MACGGKLEGIPLSDLSIVNKYLLHCGLEFIYITVLDLNVEKEKEKKNIITMITIAFQSLVVTPTNWGFFSQLSIELASDHKDFSTALAKTRLAEMNNPKMIPIPPTRPKSRSPKRRTSQERSMKNMAGK